MATSRQAELLRRENAALVERALRRVYVAILPSLLRRDSPGWGPGPLSSERSWEFFCQLADEVGDWNWRLAEGQDPSGAMIRRVERGHQEDAAGELVTLVRRMPTPVRLVVEARSCGVSWKRLTTELPDRAYFSMVDDWRRALATIHEGHDDLVRRLV